MWSLKVMSKNWSLSYTHKVSHAECQSWPWCLTPWLKINKVPAPITHKSHIKIESNWIKTEVCIVPSRFWQSANVDIWPSDSEWKGFIFSASTQLCSLKVIWLKLWSVSCQQCFIYRVPKLTWPLTPWPKISRVRPLIIRNLGVKFG